jgi:hypothetical protein
MSKEGILLQIVTPCEVGCLRWREPPMCCHQVQQHSGLWMVSFAKSESTEPERLKFYFVSA